MGLCGNFTRRITNEILGVRGLHNNKKKQRKKTIMIQLAFRAVRFRFIIVFGCKEIFPHRNLSCY